MKSRKNLMDEDEFWELIEHSKNQSRDIEEQYKVLKEMLKELPDEKILGFSYHFLKAYAASAIGDLWSAPYLRMGGCSDDSFDYFRFWLISRGRKVYYEALENPDSLVHEFGKLEYRDSLDGETFGGVYFDAFEEKNSKDLDDSIEEYKGDIQFNPDWEFTWEEDDEESMKRMCPKIFERFWMNPLKWK